MSNCSRYETYARNDVEHPTPCKCPVCGGFLKWDKLKPICNKCKTELMVFPDLDEETGDELDYMGKICPVEMPRTFINNQEKR